MKQKKTKEIFSIPLFMKRGKLKEKEMKKRNLITVLIFGLACIFGCLTAWADCPGPDCSSACEGAECYQNANGNAAGYGFYEHGDITNGGWAESYGIGDYAAEGFQNADGGANAYIQAEGANSPGEAWSHARSENSTWGNGEISVNLSVEGTAEQGSWAGQDNGDGTYGMGGGNSYAEFNGSKERGCDTCDPESLSLSGIADAAGNTYTELNIGAETNSSLAENYGSSEASQTGNGSVFISGIGSQNNGSYKEINASWGGAMSDSAYCYSGEGTNQIAGFGEALGNTTATVHDTGQGIEVISNAWSRGRGETTTSP